MRNTVSNKVLIRIAAQADEADVYGDTKVSDNIMNQIKELKTRKNSEEYSYSKQELTEDLQKLFWDAAIRMFDFYDTVPDTKKIQDIIDSEIDCFTDSINSLIDKDKGEYEDKTPGESDDDNEIHEKIFEINENEDDENDEEDEYVTSDDIEDDEVENKDDEEDKDKEDKDEDDE